MKNILTLAAALAVAALPLLGAPTGNVKIFNQSVRPFLESHCYECHDDSVSKGGLDLTKVPFEPDDSNWRAKWARIHDRIEKEEMPPKAGGLKAATRAGFIQILGAALHDADLEDVKANGRGPLRRLTRAEYENNLRDLLKLPHLDIRDRLPEDRTSAGFTKAAATLDMSRVQLDAYLDAADAALTEAMAYGLEPVKPTTFRAVGSDLYNKTGEHGGREALFFSKRGKMVPISNGDIAKIHKSGKRDDELELGIFRSATWPYYGYPRGFRAKHTGAFRVRFSARAVRQLPNYRMVPASRPMPMTFRARQPSGADVSGDVRATGGWMDVPPNGAVFETTVRLKAGETFEYSLLGLPVPHPITSHGGPLYYDFPPMPEEGHPGAAFQWLEVEGPLPPDSWPPPSHRALFAGLPIGPAAPGAISPVAVVSRNPGADAERLFRRFAARAAQNPLPEAAHEPFLTLIRGKLDAGSPFAEALLAGYKAFLCSGHFLYLPEPANRSDRASFAVAARLSHFLWNSRPDEELAKAAAAGNLHQPAALRAQVDRLIADPRFERFVGGFTGEWLDLNELRRDLPDIRLYPEYRKDDYLVDSMERQTRACFTALVRENLPVVTLVDADFAFVNDKLARHYGLAPVNGSFMRKVALPDWSPHGGLMTHASVMKITANGTTTSPVLRGAWVMEKLIGQPPPPPPASVPAVEPDIRGAKSIRDILAAHTKSKSCAACHARFDPVGFALENFDIMGAWRDRYRGMEKGEKITGVDRAGHAFEYRIAQPVHSSGQLLSGEKFADIRELKAIFAGQPRQLARNLLSQFTLYATGTPVRFSDRRQIEAILDQTQAQGHRVRDLLHGLIQSRIFTGDEL